MTAKSILLSAKQHQKIQHIGRVHDALPLRFKKCLVQTLDCKELALKLNKLTKVSIFGKIVNSSYNLEFILILILFPFTHYHLEKYEEEKEFIKLSIKNI